MMIDSTPTLVAALEGGAHQLGVAHALERVVDAAVGHIDDHLLDGLVELLRVDEVGAAELARHLLFTIVDVDADDARSLGHLGALDARQTDAAQPEHRHRRAGLDLGGVQNRADPGGDPAAEQQIFSSGAAGFTLANEISGTTVYSANVDVPM